MNRFNPHPPSESDSESVALDDRDAVTRRKTLLQKFRAYFPESSSQAAVVVTFICALAVSGIWTWWILDSRWLEQQRHPTTVITREHMDSIPMIEALAISYWYDYFGTRGENLLFHQVEAFHTGYSAPARLSDNDIRCPDVQLYGFTSACQPFINGVEAFPASISGQPRLDVSNWPLQYYNRADRLQLTVHSLVNLSNVLSVGYTAPHVTAFILTADQLISVKNLVYNGSYPTLDEFLPVANNLPHYVPLMLGLEYELGLTLTKRVDVNGNIAFDWMMSEFSAPLTPNADNIQSLWYRVLSALPADEQTRLNNLRAMKDVQYFPLVINLSPTSFDVQVITSKELYGFLNFISDVGGFLNILAIAFTLIFPFSHVLIRPRVFLPFYIYRLIRSGEIDKIDEKQHTTQRQIKKEDAITPNDCSVKGAVEIAPVSELRSSNQEDEIIEVQMQQI